MNKTKLGISTGLMAGIIYLLAITSEFVSGGWLISMGLVLAVAYVLYKEEDVWLKISALKAVMIILVFSLVPFLFSFVDDVMSFINFFLQFAEINIRDGFGIMAFVKNIIYIVEKIFLIILALLAFKGKTIKFPVIDNMLAKHIN